jgi:acylglycerol lipase
MTGFFTTSLDGVIDLPAGNDAIAMLVIVHGLAEHRGRYRHAIVFFNSQRIAVCSFDLRGHGQTATNSMGKRGDVESFNDLIADVDTIINGVKSQYPQLPLFVWGHSMGSVVAMLAVAKRPANVRGSITSSPPFAAFDSYSPLKKKALTWLTYILPSREVPLPVNPDRLSRDAEVGRAYSADPLIPKAVTLRLLVGISKGVERCLAIAPKLRTPWLIAHGGSDRVAPPIGSQRLMDALGSVDKQIRLWPAARHEVHNELEPERNEFLMQMADWMRARSGDKKLNAN